VFTSPIEQIRAMVLVNKIPYCNQLIQYNEITINGMSHSAKKMELIQCRVVTLNL
jgi:hypothetical protein